VKQGDIVIVTGFTSAFTSATSKISEAVKAFDTSKEIGIIIEIFVKDNSAWVYFPSVGKVYVNIESLEKLNLRKDIK